MKADRNCAALVALLAAIAGCGDGPMQISTAQHSIAAGETITVLSGGGQVAVAGATLPKPVVFIVKDNGGTALGGASGTIAVSAGGGLTSKTTFTTNATGKISFTWTMGASGPQQVTIALTGAGVSTVVAATVIPIGSQLSIFGGNGQSGIPGDTLALPVRVELRDPGNNPIEGATVNYYFVDGSGGGVRAATGKTNALGRLSNFWALGWNKQAQTLVARIAGLDSVVFQASAVTTGFTLSVTGGANQFEAAGTALPALLTVQLLRNGTPVQGAKGAFVVRYGGGTLSKSQFSTNSNGRANVAWTLGAQGVQQVKAIIGAIDSVTFRATMFLQNPICRSDARITGFPSSVCPALGGSNVRIFAEVVGPPLIASPFNGAYPGVGFYKLNGAVWVQISQTSPDVSLSVTDEWDGPVNIGRRWLYMLYDNTSTLPQGTSVRVLGPMTGRTITAAPDRVVP